MRKNTVVILIVLLIISAIGCFFGYIDFDIMKYILAIFLLLLYFYVKRVYETFDYRNKYIFITDESFKSSSEDEHIDIYYDIDLRKMKVLKKKDKYINSKGKVSEEILKIYNIDKDEKMKIRKIFTKIIDESEDSERTLNDDDKHYVLRTSDGFEIMTYNYNLINEFESMFE